MKLGVRIRAKMRLGLGFGLGGRVRVRVRVRRTVAVCCDSTNGQKCLGIGDARHFPQYRSGSASSLPSVANTVGDVVVHVHVHVVVVVLVVMVTVM